ncbi:MAG: 1-(5-phosphoribosyl)-5-((5-phosphoribosylamino)methylideneamino)imidazole-4-carboxamide isomerase [Alphaproteobacteria bacterium]|nr:1-(5-phosphoribosyl)-5-((5-phosphoribosylamino)methylideneamino)imidazole-4-carboxamide isomerase [Alphaproteobacteria bacterium]
MIILPAMDLMGNACVRLYQGDFGAQTRYPLAPADALAGFEKAGANWAHVVDLDGARAGAPLQHDFIAALARGSALSLQVAGGVRKRAHVRSLLAAGVSRVVVGSLALREPETIRDWLGEFGPDRLTLAFDVRIEKDKPFVAVHGWRELSALRLDEAIAPFAGTGLRNVLITDISRDGALNGPNFDLIRDVSARYPDLDIQASGGVASLDDIKALRSAGAAAAIVGKALYENRLSLEEAIHAGA